MVTIKLSGFIREYAKYMQVHALAYFCFIYIVMAVLFRKPLFLQSLNLKPLILKKLTVKLCISSCLLPSLEDAERQTSCY